MKSYRLETNNHGGGGGEEGLMFGRSNRLTFDLKRQI